MKKALLILATLSMGMALFAQTGATGDFQYQKAARPYLNEVNLSYGVVSMQDVAMAFSGVFTTIVTAPAGMKYGEYQSSGVIAAEYMRYLKSGRFAFGAVVGYENMTVSFVNEDRTQSSKSNTDFLMVMPSAKVVWFNRKHVGMYSRVAVGAMVGMKEKIASFMFQVDAVGVDFGGEHLRGFAYFGLGAQGIAGLGLKYSM